MVPLLHQNNVYIKRKLQVWRVQKCIHLVGAKIALTYAGLQTTSSHLTNYRAENGNLWKSGSTFRHGTVFPPKQCLYQKEATGMESPKMHSSSRCKNRTYLCGTSNYLVSSNQLQGRERKFVEIRFYLSSWYCVSTKAMFISKGSYRYGESKMHSSSRCKHRTNVCRTSNFPVSSKLVQGRERKFAKIRVYLSPLCRVCTKAMFISKGSYRYGESKNAFL